MTIIRNPTLMTARDETVTGTIRLRTTGERTSGISTASDRGSGAGKIVQT
jgi:hypothetical protein